ncbi:U3 small nucleolar RNA-associated protein 13 [Thecaphora frezii]
MADAVVLTPEQIQQLLAQQNAASSNAAASAGSTSNKPRIKTSFAKERTIEPFYTGGAVALTPDGEWLASTMNEEVVVVEVKTGNVLHRIESDTEEVTALTISPSGSHLIIASRSLALRTYTLPGFHLVRSTPKSHTAQVNVMTVDPTSTLLATGSSDGIVKVWDIIGGYCTHVFRGHGGVVSGLCWNMPDPALEAEAEQQDAKGKGKNKAVARTNGEPPSHQRSRRIELFTGSVDGKIRLWDLTARTEDTQKPAAVLTGHVSVVRGLTVTDDGKMLVSGSRDNSIIVWRLVDDRWRQSDTLAADEGVESTGFLPRGTRFGSHGHKDRQTLFYTGGSDGQVKLWDAEAGTIICCEPKSLTQNMALEEAAAGNRARRGAGEDEAEETRAITAIQHIALTSTLVSVHADQNIVMRSVAADSALSPLTRVRQMVGFNDEIVDLALLAALGESEETHVALATNSNSIRVYNIDSQDHNVSLLYGHSDVVLCLDRSPDSRWMASGAKDRTAHIWAWIPRSRLPEAQGGIEGADAQDSGKKIDRNGKSKKGSKATNPGSDGSKSEGEWICVAVCEGHAESVGAIAFARRAASPGAIGAPFMITASQDRTAKLWDLSALNMLLSGDDDITAPLRLKSLLTLKIHDKDINCLDIAPNNALLASGSQDRTAKIFAITFNPPTKANNFVASAQLKPLSTLKGHKRGVWSVRFSPVDLALATGSGDKTIRLWSLNDYTCVKIFEGHTNSVLKLQFCSAGMQLVSCAGDGLVKLWNVKEEECVETLDGHEEKVWSIALKKDESQIVSAAADSVVNFWVDRTEANEAEKAKQREEEVLKEQDFSNYLTLKDYRNAIALALSMNQPRRLLGLFTHVNASRPEGDGSTSAGLLLDAALQNATLSALPIGANSGSSNFDALANAGVLSLPSAKASKKRANHLFPEGHADATSITGLAAVDEVLASLPHSQLIQLMSYVRDWNTSVRTSGVAQTILHALLRSYPASELIEAFEGHDRALKEAAVKRLEDIENGVIDPESVKEQAERRRRTALAKGGAGKVDLASMIDSLLPYTERHYARADRTLIESSMVEFTLGCMDAVLGPIDDLDEDEAEAEAEDELMLEPEAASGRGAAMAYDEDEDEDNGFAGDAMEVDATEEPTFGQKLKSKSKKDKAKGAKKKGTVTFDDASASESD